MGGYDPLVADMVSLGSPPLHESVRRYLHDAIVQGRFKPGGRIIESRLARELSVSQAPIREALRELEQMGLVVHHPRRGASVRKITADDAWELYSLRAHLEVMAAQLALGRITADDLQHLEELVERMREAALVDDHDRMTRIDAQFHEYICERSGHRLLLKTWRSNNPLTWTLITVALLERHDLLELAERHTPIIAALRSKDPQVVEDVIREHLLVIGREAAEHLREAERQDSESGDGRA